MSKKLKMPANGLFGLPSPDRQTNNEETISTQEPKNPSTEVLSTSNTQEPKNPSTEVLTKKNNQVKDDKKPTRKQASVHLTGATLKALHLYAYEEGLEKSEVVEKALRKFIPKKFFQ